MARGTAVIEIQRGQYILLGIDEPPRGIPSDGNGLFVSEPGRDASVSTGTADGPLRLTVETCSQAPALELEGWDDVVEVSQRADDDSGGVGVAPLFDDPVEELPYLAVAPGSPIRIRVHARGRDEASRFWGVDEPIEEHLLQMWPAPEAEEVCHRLSDAYGEIMRAQWSDESNRIRLASGFARVDVRAGTYALTGIDAGPLGIRSAGSGLFVSDSEGARVLTGTAEGPVWLTLEEYAESPPLRLEGWDEVVEVSQRSDTGEVKVAPWHLAEPVALPKVRVPPGSSIRLRVHARGRDEAAKHRTVDEAIEEHLVQVWAAPVAEELWHRLSDEVGEMRARSGPIKGPAPRAAEATMRLVNGPMILEEPIRPEDARPKIGSKTLFSIDMVELPSSAAATSGAFFEQAFGWTPAAYGADYVDVQGGGIFLGIQSDLAERPGAPLVVIRADDLNAARAAIEAAGGTVTVEPFDFPGGRRFHFREPGGCELAVWRPS